MRMGIPGECQGQMVERSYGWYEGSLYMRVRDHSDRTTQWFIADEESTAALPEGYDPGGEGSPPTVETWTPCEEPKDTETAEEWSYRHPETRAHGAWDRQSRD